MLKKEDFVMIKARDHQGVYLKNIADELGVHPRTVRRALDRGSAPKLERERSGSKLDPYKPK